MKRGPWVVVVRAVHELCAACLLVLCAIVVYEVVSRYAFDEPTIWVQEVAVYLLIAVTFLGLAPTQHAGEHIRIDVLTRRLSEPARRALEAVTLLSLAAFALVAAWGGGQMVAQSLRFGRRSPTLLAVPVWIPQLLLPIGMLLLAFGALVAAWHLTRRRNGSRRA
jgi:C4-dicarboxylate transporter DctQ subunit